MLAKLFLQYLFAIAFGMGVDEGYATIYGTPGDIHAGGDMACGGGKVPQKELLCAHRWLPCNTQVVVMNLEHHDVATCRVSDRGPYGVDKKTGEWRGVIDLTPGTAKAVSLDGRDLVRIFYKLPASDHKVWQSRNFAAPRRRGGPAM